MKNSDGVITRTGVSIHRGDDDWPTELLHCVLDPIITCSILISLNNGFTNTYN